MHFSVERRDAKSVTAHLREGGVTTEVVGWNPEYCARQLRAALEAVEIDGYGECFWPEPTGQYWWMLKRDENRMEVAVLWSRSSAVGWQHVFRATDEVGYVRDLINEALSRAFQELD
jgi:hypothetical protein